KPAVNILDKLKEAKAGSDEALKLVRINIATAIYEACFKRGYIRETKQQRSSDGHLIQHGQSSRDIHTNALTMRPNRHPDLKNITEIEALNGERIEDALRADKLKTHYFIAMSVVPEGVPEHELGEKGDGYFLDYLTYSVQATSEEEDDVITETAFIAGVEADEGDSFEEIMQKRHDIKALQLVYKKLGLTPPSTTAGFLHGIYVAKSLMPNGVAD